MLDSADFVGLLAACNLDAARLHRFRQFALKLDLQEAIVETGALHLHKIREVEAAARTLGMEVAPLAIRRAEDIAPAFAALKGEADALYVVTDMEYPRLGLIRIENFDHFLADAYNQMR